MRRSVFLGGSAVGWLLLRPTVAQAHLVSTGLGPIYDGISHLFVSIEDLLPVIAIALLAGLNGAVAGRRMLFALPLVWLAGGVAGTWMPVSSPAVAPAALSLLVLGVLTAADFKLAPAAVMTLALALGLAHGWHNGIAISEAGLPAVGLVGITTAVFVVAALVSALVVAMRAPWTRIAVRATGSWIAATGLLLAGWSLSGRL
jgi:urease accessory protein